MCVLLTNKLFMSLNKNNQALLEFSKFTFYIYLYCFMNESQFAIFLVSMILKSDGWFLR